MIERKRGRYAERVEGEGLLRSAIVPALVFLALMPFRGMCLMRRAMGIATRRDVKRSRKYGGGLYQALLIINMETTQISEG